MKIVRQSTSAMVCKQNALGSRLFGLLFASMGVIAIYISNQNKTAATIIGLVFVFLGLLVTFLSKTITIYLDKDSSVAEITFSSLLGKKTQKIPFNQIREIAIEAHYKGTGSFARKNIVHNLVIYTVEGDNILVSMDSGMSGWVVMGHRMLTGHSTEAVKEMGNTIARFVNVLFTYLEPPSLNEAIHQASIQMKPRKK